MKDREEGEEEESHRATVKRKRSAAGSSSPPPPPGPATDIHDLPDEVLAKIFALLSLKMITKVLSVCQRWRSVIQDDYLSKKLVLKDGEVTRQEALRLIRSARKLKSLELVDRSDTVALLDAASARCTNLLHLSVNNPFDTISLPEALGKVFQSSPRITTLCLKHGEIANQLRFCKKLGIALPSLRKLEVCIVPLSRLELDAFVDSCCHNQMEEFKAPDNRCSEETMGKIVRFWRCSLRVLELDAWRWSDGALAQLLGCSELRRLKLNLRTTGEGLCVLSAFSHLEELDLFQAKEFEHENWYRFFSQSRSSQGLRKLSLKGRSAVDDRVLDSIAAFCPQLKKLEAYGRNMTISGVREVLRCCPKMQDLYLYGTNASVALIVPELPQLAPQLHRIFIGSRAKRALSQATLRRVQAQMPHLTIS